MGYVLQANAPQFTVAGRKYAITANLLSGPVVVYVIALVEWDEGGQQWLNNQPMLFQVASNGEGSLMKVLEQYGGLAGLLAQIRKNIIDLFAKIFNAAPPSDNPQTDAEVFAAIQAWLAKLVIDTSTTPPTVT